MFEGDISQWVRNPDVRLGAYVALPTALVLLLTGVAYRLHRCGVRLRRGRSPRTIWINRSQEGRAEKLDEEPSEDEEGGAEKLAEEPSEDVGACATTSMTAHRRDAASSETGKRQVTYSEWL